ncbi:MAG TPA: hypothetical protein VME20_09025 [Acidimicrobiales bacterium]|nr:hypothetical protein [Acidimicrobiales bacterium]
MGTALWGAWWPPAPAGASGRAPASPPSAASPSPSTQRGGGTPNPQPPRPDVLAGPDSLELLSQTAWVGPAQSTFDMELQVTASDASTESLAVVLYGALSARSEFQAALAGQVSNYLYSPPTGPVPLSDLARGPDGGAEVEIPLGALSLGTGVYPVQVFLEKLPEGVRVGQPLTTFLVYAGKDASSLQPLRASFVIPVAASVPVNPQTGAPGLLPGPAEAELASDTAQLAAHHVPMTVAADVATVEAMARAGPEGKAAVAALRSAIGSGDELLPSTALPVDMPSLVSSGLSADLATELAEGSSALGDLLGSSPGTRVWAFPDGTDPTTLAALVSSGARQVTVPEADLSPLPATQLGLTFAEPASMREGGTSLEVIGADTELSSRVAGASAPGQAVLVANQVLAELAMIDLEAPGDRRGVVLLPAAGTVVSPVFLTVVLSGLQGDPLVQATTLAEEFSQVPATSMQRSLEGPTEGAQLEGAGGLQQAADEVSADGDVYGGASPAVSALDQQLLVSLSSVFNGKQRAAIITAADNAARLQLARIRLPAPASITLTSHDSRLPLAILYTSSAPATVRLLLSSDELSFVPEKFREGACSPIGAGSESCALTITKTTTLQIPVAVRTSGVFQLSLALGTPNGDFEIAESTDTVRSTATSGVALAVMAGAAFFLAVWWARNARHGRRARKLVPRASDGEASQPTPAVPIPAGTPARASRPGRMAPG